VSARDDGKAERLGAVDDLHAVADLRWATWTRATISGVS